MPLGVLDAMKTRWRRAAAEVGNAVAASAAAEAVIMNSRRDSFFMAEIIVADAAWQAPVPAALRGAKKRPLCCPRIALRFILGYFRPLPDGRDVVFDLHMQR